MFQKRSLGLGRPTTVQGLANMIDGVPVVVPEEEQARYASKLPGDEPDVTILLVADAPEEE